MNTRIRAAVLIAAALVLALSGCSSQAGGSSTSGTSGGSSGGSTGGSSGGSSTGGDSSGGVPAGGGGDLGRTPHNDLGDAGKEAQAAGTKDAHGGFGPTTRSSWGGNGCKIWFGVSYASSGTYMVVADKFGIGGHVQWECTHFGADMVRWHLEAAKLQWALTGTSTSWTDADGPGTTANVQVPEMGASGVRFPYTDHCTTDAWRVVATFDGETTSGGTGKITIVSDWRQVTSEDCDRE